MAGGLSNRKYRRFASAGIAVLLCSPTLTHSVDLLDFDVTSLDGPDWSATGIHTALELSDDGIRATLHIAELRIAAFLEPAQDLRLDCAALVLGAKNVACEAASITGHFPYLESQRLSAGLRYDHSAGVLQWEIRDISLAGGELALAGELHGAHWRLALDARNIDPDRLLTRIGTFTESVPDIAVSGRLSSNLAITGTPQTPTIEGTIDLESVQASNEPGTVASDALSGSVTGKLERSGGGWRFDLTFEPVSGQLYIEPVFIDVGQEPFSLGLAGGWREGSGALAVETFRYQQPGVGEVSGSMRIDLAPAWTVGQMEAEIRNARLPRAYEIYLAPYLFGTELDSLESAGSFNADVSIDDSDLRELRIALEQVHLDDDKQRFAVYGLQGLLEWKVVANEATSATPPSRVRWDGGFVFGVQMGSGEIDFRTQNQDFALLGAIRLPLLDGGLLINVFEISRLAQPDMRIAFDASIEPISLHALTSALGWPVFGGTLSGTLPQLTYELGELTLGGKLEARVFGGEISVEKLKVTEPFGLVPQLSANIRVRGIDLEKATETFSFGKITGLLDGEIRELHMLDWEPTAFDAKFQTPGEDTTRRRISQRAIENISSLSGQSVTAVLSSGFLRFFDEFAYDKITVSCRLKDDVCSTGALLPEGERYYIVKGKGVPRIDVIGYSRRVAWPVLIDRLKSIRYEEAVID